MLFPLGNNRVIDQLQCPIERWIVMIPMMSACFWIIRYTPWFKVKTSLSLNIYHSIKMGFTLKFFINRIIL
jgi:hypothetical protein